MNFLRLARRRRISIRAAVVCGVGLLLAVAAGLIFSRHLRQSRTLARLEEAGFTWIPGSLPDAIPEWINRSRFWIGPVVSLETTHEISSRTDLHGIGEFSRLEQIRINLKEDEPVPADWTRTLFYELSKCSDLRTVRLFGPAIVSDEDVALLAACSKLEEICFEHSTITDAGLERLKSCRALSRLRLSGSKVQHGLVHLDRNAIVQLNVSSTQVDDAGIAGLRGAPRLESLWLAGCPITDASCEVLASMPVLRTLDVSRTALTPKELQNLRSCRDLIVLMVVDTGIDEEQLLTLSRDLHDVLIVGGTSDRKLKVQNGALYELTQ